ncbi:MAG: hypothetical protein ACRDN0_01635 [Trebonia sp.]
MSFASDPGRDDSGLPPVHIVVPDDARELDRDVLAYRREMRARRRRERLMRVLRPLHRSQDRPRNHSAVLPLIFTCVALSMLAGAMLSVVTISPASAPTVTATASAAPTSTAGLPVGLSVLPAGDVRLDGQTRPIRGIASAVVALIPGDCACGTALLRLADQAAAAHVRLYFVGEGSAIPQMRALTTQYGGGSAVAGSDDGGVLDAAYRPAGLTVLMVYSDATAQVQRDLKPGFQLVPVLRLLSLPGREVAS